MISSLRGKIIEKGPTISVIDCQGLGFLVHTPLSTSQKMGEKGVEVNLYIETIFNRDGIALYGFATPEEREVFNILTQVPGVGPKAALNLLSRLEAKEIKSMITLGKVETLQTIPGIGRKKAEMIVFKLKETVEKVEEPPDTTGDALKALISLGVSRKEANERLKRIANLKELTLTEILQKALSNAK
ncbi:MAG: Holliday junction branch migration protein RuvA [bacterium]|nr:Holliday junction branch migration protein RuvA [candidate division WOR-3 bacterium]MDH5682884.1 Holliday junction branch migration protein RuvA [candidate division WOR-3 bacterium]